MATEAKSTNYWISSTALYIQLNAMGEPDYIQCSVVSGASVLCYMSEVPGLGYDAGHNYQRWPLAAYPSIFPDSERKYVYIAIPRQSTTDNNQAIVVFPGQKIDIYGKAIIEQTKEDGSKEVVSGEQIGNEAYYYIFTGGIISAVKTDADNTRKREWEQHFDCGKLATDEAIASGGDGAWWRYNSVSDTITFLKTILKANFEELTAKVAKTIKLVLNGKDLTGVADNTTIETSNTTVVTPQYLGQFGVKHFLAKDKDDTAHGTITFEKVQNFLQGMNIGDHAGQWTRDGVLSVFKFLTNNFDQGLYGHGAQIDEYGNIEANSIFARQFISAPKFVFNEIAVTKAEQWNTNGYGTIKSVDVTNHTITLKLEENDYGSLSVGDICRGIFADIDNTYDSDTNNEGEMDDCGFIIHRGFFTTYFYVKKIITSEKGKFVFEYGKRSEVTPDPCAFMDFAQYGNFTDEKRQSSMYFCSRGNSYIEVLDGVNNWEIYPQNRVCRYGWLGGLAIKRRDGSYIHPSGNGIFVQDNVYFGGNVEYLGDILGLDDLKNEAKAYDVSLSQYQSVVTVDDMGNVINGLYTQDEGKATKQYRISTAVFVRKGMDILLEEDANSENVTEGHYRLHVISNDCDVEVKNSTVFVKGIKNIKDGVAGTADDTKFDYAAMRKMSDAMVTIVVDLEGKTSKTVQMPIRIQHDSLPFMVCDLSNESASVAWNTRAGKYIGFPIRTKVSLMYHNEPWTISSLNISNVAGLKASKSNDGNAKVITIDADNLTADTLAQITKMNITVVGKYAGASYEYTRELTILKSSDTVVYELIPSADSVIIDNQGNMSAQSISCNVWATSSDDKRYKLTELPAGYHLKHGTSDTPDTDMEIGAEVSVQSNASQVVFALYDASGNVLDKESVPVLTCGADGDGYEYIYYLSDQSESNFIRRPYRQNGVLQPMGWQDDPMDPTLEKQYVYVAYKTGEVGADGSFSEPKLFNRYPKSISRIETWYYAAGSSDINPSPSLFRDYGSQDFSEITLNDDTPWLWIMKITWFTDGDEVINISCEGYKAKDGQDGQDGKDGDGLIVGYQSSASEPSVLPTPKTLAEYDKAQDDIGHGWTKTAPATGGKSIVPGGKITTDEIIDRYNSSTSAWGTEESEILLDGIKQKKTFYKTPSSLGDNGKCIRRIKVVNHFRDSYLRVMLKSYSETNWDLVCISRLYLPSEVINNKGEQIKEDSEYLNRSEYAYVVSGDGQSIVANLSMPDAGEYYFFIGYFKDGSTDSYGDYGLFAWQSMIALTESLWRTDGTVDAVGNITWSKAMPMQAEAIVMERAYIATANDTLTPAKPYRTNGILQGGWTAKRLAVSSVNRFIWESIRAGKHGTDSVQDDWSQPVIVANFAEAGKMGKNGCIVRNSEGWKSGATYHNDSALTLEQKYIDLIYIEDSNANDGWSIYQCNVTHTATGSSFDPSATDSDGNRLWVKLSDAGPMYSPLIVGKNAVLKFAQGQQFNLMEGNNIFGSFRWVKNNADYAFWIGGTEGSKATTSITRGGKFKTTDADITGKITATSGQIAGMKISGLSLTNEGLNNDARIILRNDKRNTYAAIGGNVLPTETGLKAVASFTYGETKSKYDINSAMIVGASGAGTNIAIDITGGYINGLRIRTAYLTSGGEHIYTPEKIPKGVNSVIIAGAGYYELPAMDQNDDGYVIFVKNEYDGSVNISASHGVTVDGISKYAFILYDRGNQSTDLTIESRGDAMVFVYHRDVSRSDISSQSGCWVQYKCPRDW